MFTNSAEWLSEEQDLVWLVEQLHPIRSKWYSLGLQLGVSPGDLDAFDKQHKGDCDDILIAVIRKWLTRGSENYPPTKRVLANALRSNAVGKPMVARQIAPGEFNVLLDGHFANGICWTRAYHSLSYAVVMVYYTPLY